MIHTLEWKAMGSHMLVAVEKDGPRPALLDLVPAWFEEWEQVLSRFRPDSELNRLNQSRGAPFYASQTLWDVHQAAQDAVRLSQGLVSPTMLEALEEAGYTQTFELINPQADRGRSLPRGSGLLYPNRESVIVPKTDCKRIIITKDGERFDFGGIAKGWAAQQAVERLKEAGPSLVDAGGDIAISGERAGGEHWPIGVENPFLPETDLTTLHLGSCGVATSGRDYHRWQRKGAWMHHIIDPRTGRPADTDVLTATVIASNAVLAETAAKTALILGSQAGGQWLQSHPSFAGLLVLEDRSYIYTRNFEQYLAVENQILPEIHQGERNESEYLP